MRNIPEVAKRMLLTGDLISGSEAARLGLATVAVPEARLDAEVESWLRKIEVIPANQLAMHKLLCNNFVQQQGLAQQQTLATLFDGIARHSPEGADFKQVAEAHGWREAVRRRDSVRSKL